MSEVKFTPGPWRLNKYGGLGSSSYGTALLIVDGGGWAHDWDRRERERHSADTALILAAPDLYAALEHSLFYFDRLANGDLRSEALSFADVRGNINDALRKARGEQP